MIMSLEFTPAPLASPLLSSPPVQAVCKNHKKIKKHTGILYYSTVLYQVILVQYILLIVLLNLNC